MPVINGKTLLAKSPIRGMASRKLKAHGTSYGLGEAGYDIRISQEIVFKPMTMGPEVWIDGQPTYGRFCLASAIEEFDMPPDLVGVVHDKSTWARQGLGVFNTVIEPGWNGFLTLELVYHGNKDLIIPAGSGIAQVIFHYVSDPVQYNGRYQNQANKPVSAIKAE